ncbi:MAG: hypothetical protein GY747_02930 [Planctomycetes bacterium]|nr:hypothetical protein [Planctomycetota bacterium]MCP4770144.1 hypothetical protein [Planctomycetota bacterium]MCP4860708.1 hypothetical protein [Planctomycetota bacterium]
MELKSIRFCAISPEADQLVEFLGLGLGFPCVAKPLKDSDPDSPQGGIFHAGDSWIEIWPEGANMPQGVMLQVIVDDANEYAEHAKSNGIEMRGPMHANGECIYFALAPGGLAMTIQSPMTDEQKEAAANAAKSE